MKTRIIVSALVLLFSCSYAFADLYEWRDKEGVIHITDDIKKVPESYRANVKVFKSTPVEKAPAPETSTPAPAVTQEKPVELYGDHTLEWWLQTFTRKKEEIQMLESNVTAKRQFIDVFEGGRRFGQTYPSNEIETYGRYKKELPDDMQRLTTLKDEMDDLRRKATIAGVPREIRD